MGIFSCQNVFLKSNGYQLTSADIGPDFANLTKIKHIVHAFHSVSGPEFEFEGNNLQIQTQGLKLSGKHASYV